MAIAFRVGGLLSPSVMEVHPSHRGNGFGTKIVDYFIAQARKENVNVLRVQCQPKESIPFWKEMGFRLYGESFGSKIDPDYGRHAFRVLEYDLAVPESGVPTLVCIEFREKKEDSDPFESRTLRGRRIDDTIHLDERFVAYFPFRYGTGDVCCRLTVGDMEVCSDKLKRGQFKENGFQVEEHSQSYFADQILLG